MEINDLNRLSNQLAKKMGKTLKPISITEGFKLIKHIPVLKSCEKCNKKTKQKHKETEKLHIYTCSICNNVELIRKSNMKKIKLKESDLTNIVKRVIEEANGPKIMRTVEPNERNLGPKARIGQKPVNIITPDKYENRREVIQNVIDRLMKYDRRYMRELERLNEKYPIEPDYFGRYSYDDIASEEI